MISGSIARRYAKALLLLGLDGPTPTFELLGAELGRFVKLLSDSPELRAVLVSPIVPVSKRKAIIDDVLGRLGASRTMQHFLQLIADSNRLPYVEAIAREYGVLVDAQAGRVRALMSSPRAEDLTDGALELRIKRALERRTGKQVILEKKHDPSLLAGLVVQIGDVIYDGSARAGLARIREELLA